MPRRPKRGSEEKAPKTYRFAAARIARARQILGTESDTATIEMALDLVVFRDELVSGVDAIVGADIYPIDKT
jgi:hypothetical protein